MTKSVNFTKTTLDKLTTENKNKRTYYQDTQVIGLSFAVQPSGAKSFYVVKKIGGQSAKIFLGKYPDLSIENARKKARIVLGQIAEGINPQAEKQQKRAEPTFGQLFDEYMTRHSKLHKRTWEADQRDIPRLCGKWFNKRLSEITRDDCRKLYETVFVEKGLHMANTILRKVRAMYNQADKWGWPITNPAAKIELRRETARDRFVQPFELPYLLHAIEDEKDGSVRDYFKLLLLTGVRKTNAIKMRWEQVNWSLACWRIPGTKNGDPLTVPLTDQAIDLLRNRRQSSTSPWVFPSSRDNQKHYSCMRAQWVRIRKTATNYLRQQEDYKDASMTDIRIHDLRRTFGSYQAISGASLQIIGKSLGHRSTEATQIYARLTTDAVRESVVKATELMFAPM
jgi:integrase